MIRRMIALWLPAAFGLTVIAFAGYGLVQQALRSGANDPQVALAREAAGALDSGAAPATVAGGATVSVTASLQPWVAVYDSSRHLVASSGRGVESFPTSVFDSVPAGGRDEVTWQPQSGVRQAAVVVGWKHGWVVAGRSLQLVEEREQSALLIAIAGWAAALLASAFGAFLGALWASPPERGLGR